MSLNMSPRSESSDDGSLVNDILSLNKNRIQTPPLLHNQLNESGERFETLPIRSQHEKFLRQCVEEIFSTAIFGDLRRENKVLNFHQPIELAKLFDMSLKSGADNDDTLLELLRKTIHYSVKTGHPYFVNQLYSCVDAYGLVGQWLTDALNPSVYTYEVSPVFILMEETVLRQMRSIIGWESGNGDGLFSPGGSISNGYGISCARYKFTPDVKTKGLVALPRLVMFTSEDAHYSSQKLASFMGLGSDNVYKVNTCKRGKLIVEHLESEVLRAKSEGALPFLVVATAGTTVLGAFDPIDDIADVCKKYNMWLHVDAAWGGGALMSSKYRQLLRGIERADSVTWNPHKLLAVPQQCSTFLTKHEGILQLAHSANATYLFQKDKFYDTQYDTGDKHIQCGRRADVLKFWFMWRAKGSDGFEAHINKNFDNAEYFTSQIKSRHDFEMVVDQPECTNICFWYIPPSLQNLARDSDEFKQKIHKIAPTIKERMMKEGNMMITYQPLRSTPNFFRLVLQSSALNRDDMLHFIDTIERLGCNL